MNEHTNEEVVKSEEINRLEGAWEAVRLSSHLLRRASAERAFERQTRQGAPLVERRMTSRDLQIRARVAREFEHLLIAPFAYGAVGLIVMWAGFSGFAAKHGAAHWAFAAVMIIGGLVVVASGYAVDHWRERFERTSKRRGSRASVNAPRPRRHRAIALR